MANDIEFVDGLIVKAPRDGAPDYVKASISIKVEDLGMWLRKKHKAGDEWVNIDVKESKAGKWYAAVNTYKPRQQREEESEPARTWRDPSKPAGKFDDLEDDIPW
jgi:hypothetical protein